MASMNGRAPKSQSDHERPPKKSSAHNSQLRKMVSPKSYFKGREKRLQLKDKLLPTISKLKKHSKREDLRARIQHMGRGGRVQRSHHAFKSRDGWEFWQSLPAKHASILFWSPECSYMTEKATPLQSLSLGGQITRSLHSARPQEGESTA